MALFRNTVFVFFLTFPILSQSPQETLDTLISTMNSVDSIRANLSINGTINGSLSYKRPFNIHLKLSDGRIVAANGRHLWIYSPTSAIAGKQDLKGSSAGLGGILSGYESVTGSGKTLRLFSEKRYYEEIIVSLNSNNTLKSLRMKPKGSNDYTEITLSGVQTNIGLTSGLFNFHPPANAQIVENPLNQKE
jgi:outer membrane lipoprotein carrier protein